MKRISVFVLGTYPDKSNLQRGIFNARAAEGLRDVVDLKIASIRSWRPGRKMLEIEEQDGFTVYHLCLPKYPSNNVLLKYFNIWSSAFWIRKLLGSHIRSCDLIHSITGSTYGVYASVLSAAYKKPHLMQLTGSDINAEFPMLMSLSYVKKLPKRIKAVVGNNEVLVPAFNKLFKTDFPNRFVYRGVNLDGFAYSDNIAKQSINFLFVGGLGIYKDLPYKMNTKGGLTLMSAWKQEEERLNASGAKLMFGGPDSDRAEFQDWKASLKYPDNVILLGLLSQEKMKEAYRTSNVVILPSMEEGLPNVAVEASASGRIVLGSRVGGVPEVIEEGKTGYMFEAGNSDLLASSLVKIAEEKDKLLPMGKAARQKMEQEFNQRNFAPAYLAYYKEMLASK